jgi:hypothetical protein
MRARVLHHDDWTRVPRDTELSALVPMLRPGMDEVHVVENDDGEIVGCWALIQAAHAEGIWTREDHRGSGSVLFALWRQMKQRARAHGWTRLFTSAASDDVRALITSDRVGGQPFPESFSIGVD